MTLALPAGVVRMASGDHHTPNFDFSSWETGGDHLSELGVRPPILSEMGRDTGLMKAADAPGGGISPESGTLSSWKNRPRYRKLFPVYDYNRLFRDKEESHSRAKFPAGTAPALSPPPALPTPRLMNAETVLETDTIQPSTLNTKTILTVLREPGRRLKEYTSP